MNATAMSTTRLPRTAPVTASRIVPLTLAALSLMSNLGGCGGGVGAGATAASGGTTSSGGSNGGTTGTTGTGGTGGSTSTGSGAADVTVQIDAAGTGPAVNRLVLGSNVQWVDGGDNLLQTGTLSFDSNMLTLAGNMAPTVLRYPGGAQSDFYDFTRGLGALAARGSNPQAGTNSTQITYMGSGEMLQLDQNLGAAPLFTVNVLTGTAAQAAAWVQTTNVAGLTSPAGGALPKVTYWEIGNEPYLSNPNGSNPNSCELDAATYVARVNAFAQAMRAVDPTIKIGIALSNDKQNGIVATAATCQGFATTVLNGLTQPIDFISLHDAYLPYDPSGNDHPATDYYWAAMASTQSIATDFAAMRVLLQKYPALQSLPFAVTEYNAVFSFNSSSAYYYSMASPMGALFVADALRYFAANDTVLMANTWSLSGNDHWGAIHPPSSGAAPYGRPTYEVFRLFAQALQGTRLTATVTAPTFDAPNVGFSAAATGLPLITTLATRSGAAAGGTLRLILINKDYSNPHVAAVNLANATLAGAASSVITAANVLETDDLPGAFQRTDATLTPATPLDVTLPPHSVTLLTLTLQ
jgi:alpha-N-arabinofuranosidase